VALITAGLKAGLKLDALTAAKPRIAAACPALLSLFNVFLCCTHHTCEGGFVTAGLKAVSSCILASSAFILIMSFAAPAVLSQLQVALITAGLKAGLKLDALTAAKPRIATACPALLSCFIVFWCCIHHTS
jgi:hypothetical protein